MSKKLSIDDLNNESNDEIKEWLLRAKKAWGKKAQIDMTIEEMSELMKALLKDRRVIELNASDRIDYRLKVAEEIADVEIMICQMIQVYHNRKMVEKYLTEKFERLKTKVIKREKEKREKRKR